MPCYAHLTKNLREPSLQLRIDSRRMSGSVSHHHYAVRTQDAAYFMEQCLPIPSATQHLHQHYYVKSAVGKRQPRSIRLQQAGGVTLRQKFPQHGQRGINSNIKIVAIDKCFANASCSGAEIEHAHRLGSVLEHSFAYCLRNAARQCPILVKRARGNVKSRGCLWQKLTSRISRKLLQASRPSFPIASLLYSLACSGADREVLSTPPYA